MCLLSQVEEGGFPVSTRKEELRESPRRGEQRGLGNSVPSPVCDGSRSRTWPSRQPSASSRRGRAWASVIASGHPPAAWRPVPNAE